MSRDARILDRAVGVAMTSTCRWKHGAVLAKGSRVLTWSPNVLRNDSRIDYTGATYHAEEAALRELCRATGETYGRGNFKGVTAYVARVNNFGETRLSRPCKNCWKLLVSQGITEVVYTNEMGSLSVEMMS